MEPDKTITCVECGGTAHLLSHRPDDDPFQPGDNVAYTCSDCGNRLDLVLDEEAESGEYAGQ